jgi:hypothetical protein
MELLAAISSADPPSLVAWLVLAFAAALYPVGLMLGSDCSPCCDRCDVVIPFNRCVRTKCVTCSPQSGSSTPVELRAGALIDNMGFRGPSTVAVCSKNRLFVRFAASAAQQMSIGESRTIVGRIRKNWPQTTPRQLATMRPSAGGDAVPAEFTVTLQGVTMPITVANFGESLVFIWPSGAETGVFSSSITNIDASVSAARSVEIKSASVVSGTQHLNPAEVTEAALLAMVSSSLSSSGVVTITANATVNLFRYVPIYGAVSVKYWVEYTRGQTKTYAPITITVISYREAEQIPEGGFAPWTLTEKTWSSTPTPNPQPVVSGATATIYSNADTEMWFGDYIVEPVGLDNVFGFTSLETSASGYELSGWASFGIALETSCDETRYFFDPLSRSQSPQVSVRAGGPYNFDYGQVDAYLAGTQCLQFQGIDQNTYEQCVGAAHVLCGHTLAVSLLVNGWDQICPPSATVQTGPIQTKNGCPSLSSQTFTVPRDGGCCYKLHRRGCDYEYNAFACANWFYCGDLLWAVENGRCRESFTGGQGGGTWTLNSSGGGGSSPSNAYVCPPATSGFGLSTSVADGKCPRLEATVTVSAQSIAGEGSPYAAIAEEFASAMQGSYVLSGFETCLAAAHSTVVQKGNKTVTVQWQQYRGPANQPLNQRWCDPYVGEPTVSCSRPNNSDGSGGSSSVTLPAGTLYGTNAFGEGGFSPQIISGTASGELSSTRATATMPPGSAVTPAYTTIGHAGGDVVFTWCCPEFQKTVTIPPNFNHVSVRHVITPSSGTPIQFPASWLLPGGSTVDTAPLRGATIEQAAYPCAVRGFSIDWGRPYSENPAATQPLSSDGSIGEGTVSFYWGVQCEWNVSSAEDWIVISKNADGEPVFCVNVLENKTGAARNGTISITNVALSYQPSPSTYNYVVRQG